MQVTAYLLKQARQEQTTLSPAMGILRLMKLLYLINRKSLEENASLIIYDRAYALPKGPILTTVYDLTKKRKDSQLRIWERYLAKWSHQVFMIKDPGDDQLSKFDERIVRLVYDKHKDRDDFELIGFTHSLPEWKIYEPRFQPEYRQQAYPIDLADIVKTIAVKQNDPTLWSRVNRKLEEVDFYTNQIIE